MKKWIWIPLSLLVGVIILGGALLPTILSTEAGKEFLIRNVKGDLSIETLSLSWTGEQRIEKLTFQDSKGLHLSLDTLSSDCSFWNLLFRSGSIGNTRVTNPQITFAAQASKERVEGLEKEAPSPKKTKEKIWSDFGGHLTVSNGLIRVQNGGREILSIYEVKVDLDLGEGKSFRFQGETRQNDLSGTFFAQGQKRDYLEGTASIRNFPAEGLDQVVSIIYPKYQGLLLATLGDTVNANLKAMPDQDHLNIEVSIRSPRLLVDLKPTYQGNVFELTTPGRIALTVKPFLFNHFSQTLALNTDAQLELQLDRATFSYKDFSKAAGTGNLHFSGGELNQGLFVDQVSARFNTENLGKLIQLNLTSAMRFQDGGQSRVSGTLSVQNALKERSFPALDLSLENLSLPLLDRLSKTSFAKYLGNTFSGKVTKSKDQLRVSGETPLLTFQETSLSLKDTARLTSPTHFTYVVAPHLYDNLIRPFTVRGVLSALSIPINEEGLLFKKADFDLTIESERIDTKNLFSLGQANLPFLAATLKGNSLDAFDFSASSALDYAQGTWGDSILGEDVAVKATGKVNWREELEISPFNLILDGRKFKGEMDGAIEKNILILKKEIQVDFLLEPAQINPILSKDTEYPILTQPTLFHLEIKPSQIPLTEEAFASLSVKGEGEIAHLSMVNPATRYPFKFKDVQIDFDLNGATNSHTVHFEGSALEKDKDAGTLELTLSGKGKASELIAAPHTVQVSLKDFSSQIADVFFKTRGQLPDLIGPTLNMKYGMEKIGERQNLDFHIDSRDLNLDGSFALGKTLELRSPRKPLKIQWKLSEKSYDAFRRWRNPNTPLTSNNPLFEINESGELNIQVSPLSIPLKDQGEGFPKPDFNLYGSYFDANIRVDDLKLKHGRTGAITELEKFKFDITKKRVGNDPLTFEFDGNVAPYGKGKRGTIQGEGTIRDFLSSAGALDFKDVSTSIHAQIKNLPSIFIDALSKLDQSSEFSPSAFLGDLFNATFDAEVKKSQGKITMDVDASACRATFAGIVSDGMLYLHEPLKAIFTVTPQLNDVLEKSAKLVVVAIEKPIVLYIHDEGFSVPLKNLHIRNMSFKYGQLDLGQIICKNVGSTSEVGGLFKSESRGNVSIWFAPAEFNMNQGRMYVDRTEMLYNRSYQICLWGDILFPRRYVDMTLGIPAPILRASLGIQGLSDSYVLKVPVSGPFGNVQIDTGAATGKIAFLVARKHIAPKAGTWGQILGAIGDLADDQSDVPPPKPPFPWQKSN